MRRIIYLTQDEIDELVQKNDDITRHDYARFRSFQDGLIGEVSTPFLIYRRKKEETT
jgi:hypothetical protein